MLERRKINWLLILQGWAMLWVVIGHAGPASDMSEYPAYALAIYHTAYSFHMALFIAISGFLFYLTRLDNKGWTYWAMMKEKLVRFGIPFIVFTLVGLVLKSVFADSVDRSTTFTIGEFVNAIIYPYNGPMREFWFLATIMWFFALAPLWRVLISSKWNVGVAFIALALLNLWCPSTEFLAIGKVCYYAFFFFSGIVAASLYKRKPEFKKQRNFTVMAFITGGVLYTIGRFWHIPLIAPMGGGDIVAINRFVDRVGLSQMFLYV